MTAQTPERIIVGGRPRALYADPLGDLPRGGRGEALADEQFRGRVEDLRARLRHQASAASSTISSARRRSAARQTRRTSWPAVSAARMY